MQSKFYLFFFLIRSNFIPPLAVRNDGTPQPYSLLCSHLRKPARSMEECNREEWPKHLDDLRAVSVLANQAIEYSSNKNKTESKSPAASSAIKPDLIPQEKRSESSVKKDSPKKPQAQDTKKLEHGEKSKKEISQKVQHDGAQQENVSAKDSSEKFIKNEKVNQNENANSKQKVASPQTSKRTGEEKAASPSKLRAKPTEIRKPGVPDAGRFKTAKVIINNIHFMF